MEHFPECLDKKPTYFKEKIMAALILYTNSTCIGEPIPHHDLYLPKLHTMRAIGKFNDHRLKPGREVYLAYWSGRPYRGKLNKFAHCNCISRQRIDILHDIKGTQIIIDGKDYCFVSRSEIYNDPNIQKITELAINDGFDNYKDFLKYFREDFKGFIFHWTNKQYT